MLTDGSYETSLDHKRRLFSFTVHGMMPDRGVHDLFDEIEEAAGTLSGHPWMMLGDLRDAPPLPVVDERLEAMNPICVESGCIGVALVISMASTHMQVRRVNRQASPSAEGPLAYGLFDSLDEATEWLGLTVPI